MELIKHPAHIIKIEKDTVFAEVKVKSACANCAVRGACGIGDCANKIIEINTTEANNYHSGQKITVCLEQDYGFYALFLGYILPLFLVLIVLFSALALGANEISSGIYSIIVLIPYYFGLSLSKKYFQNKFHFKIDDTE